MTGFDRFVVVDWSARASPSPARPSKDAIWIGEVGPDGQVGCHYLRTRHDAEAWLVACLDAARGRGERVLAGFDFPFGYPRGFARGVTGTDDPLTLWAALAARIEDAPDNANNRFEAARDFNGLFPGIGPFWGCPAGIATDDLPARGTLRRDHGLPERRAAEAQVTRAQPCWKLYTTGSVGSQALLGLPVLHRLRGRFGTDLAVAPFEAPDRPIVLAEVFPSLISDVIAEDALPDEIPDRTQVRVLAGALSRLPAAELDTWLREGDPEEGWILGLGHEAALRRAARPLRPPPLRDDCFALPAGTDWTPVETALGLLRDRLAPVTGVEIVDLFAADGRILAEDLPALRSNPPHPNTAVDGYGFSANALEPALASGTGDVVLPLVAGRAAAGVPFEGRVPAGHAIRVLTGADLPCGVDTVVLEEDCAVASGRVAFRGGVRRGANTRAAGEDLRAGDVALRGGAWLRPQDLALAAAVGHGQLRVRSALRVAVLSTGDEVCAPGSHPGPGGIFDANRPMLLALAARWGCVPVDLGRVGDDAGALRAAFDDAAARADVVLTSGGASAGDEDHVSALLRAAGAMQEWRIAVKPGRPLALGMWGGMPVFGLPGNPVAAFVCALIFARPALSVLAGSGWEAPQGFDVPAAFAKRKKPGRHEYLRARLRDGRAEVFASEGSGRVSGLSWAEGLVVLDAAARDIVPDDPVRFLPYGAFGL